MDNTAVALGQFEAMHIGHSAVIKAAAESGYSPAVLTFKHGTLRKGDGRDVLTDEERMELFASLGVEIVIEADFEKLRDHSPKRFVKEILRDTLDARFVSCGFNYRFGAQASGDCDTLTALCEKEKISVSVSPQVTVDGVTVSTTAIRALLDSGDIVTANRMLGREFGYDFTVLDGQKLGRTLGAPTINQYFPENFLCPKFGVYASRTQVGDICYPSVTNVGVRPTVGSDAPLSETWICGFSGDLYGKNPKVSLMQYLRGEKKFSSLDELKNAIIADGERAKELFYA